MSQISIFEGASQSASYAQLCNALYERELHLLAINKGSSVAGIQAKLKSLPYYINRTADFMVQTELKAKTPLVLDTQNASWSFKQQKKTPLTNQHSEDVWAWYQNTALARGLIVPILLNNRIVLDSIDRVDISNTNYRFRTNSHGWFDEKKVFESKEKFGLLKPNKKVMIAACSGHCWQNDQIHLPIMLSLRELLLSCAINWQNFRNTVSF